MYMSYTIVKIVFLNQIIDIMYVGRNALQNFALADQKLKNATPCIKMSRLWPIMPQEISVCNGLLVCIHTYIGV